MAKIQELEQMNHGALNVGSGNLLVAAQWLPKFLKELRWFTVEGNMTCLVQTISVTSKAMKINQTGPSQLMFDLSSLISKYVKCTIVYNV
jgi:hypothetical protein